MMRAFLVVNPVARHGSAAGRSRPYIDALADRFETSILVTRERGEAEAAVASCDADTVIVLGGDGTVHEAVNGLFSRPIEDRPSLGVLPLGAGNDFARSIGIPLSPDRALPSLLEPRIRPVDVGKANGRIYANSLGIGTDARVAAAAGALRSRTNLTGTRLYLAAVAYVVRTHINYRIEASFDDDPVESLDIAMVAINVGPTYGGGFWVTPDAVNDDGVFEMCLVSALQRWEVPMRVPFVLFGKHTWMKPVHMRRARHISIHADVAFPFHLDGEVSEADHLTIEVVPSALMVIAGDGGHFSDGGGLR